MADEISRLNITRGWKQYAGTYRVQGGRGQYGPDLKGKIHRLDPKFAS
jgi:hypothetical protein